MQTTTNNTKGKEIALEIIAQLGANKFFSMTGSLVKYYDNDGSLTLKLRRNKAKAQYLRIELANDDTYTMRFFKVQSKTLENITIEYFSRVYCDQLQTTFTKVTGLLTSLGTMGK